MNNNLITIERDNLNKLKDRIGVIAFSDRERYKQYNDRINELIEKLVHINDETGSIADRDFIDIVQEEAALGLDIERYILVGEKTENQDIELTLKEKSPKSGREKSKETMIDYYKKACEDIEKREDLTIENIQELNEMWQRESKETQYSAVEVDAVEIAIAELLIEYQIKYAKKNKTLPKDLNIEEYCNIEIYGRAIKDILLEKVHETDGDSFKKLQLIDLFKRTDVIDIINNERVWKELTGVALNLENSIVVNKEEKVETETPKIEQETAMIPVNENKEIIVKVKCKVEVKSFFGKKHIQEKTVSINLGTDGTLSIPERLRKNLVSIDIPEEVRHIANEGFKGCKKLKNIFITKNIEDIGEEAFNDSAIENIEFDKYSRLKIIGKKAFSGCHFKKFITPKSVEQIENYAFEYCIFDSKGIEFEDDSKLCYIGVGAFRHSNIHRFETPLKVTQIADETFKYTDLENYHITKNIKSIGQEAFLCCLKLERLTSDDDCELEIIDAEAFKDCNNLRNITLPRKTKRIEHGAFKENNNKKNYIETQLTLNPELTFVGDYAFANRKIKKMFIPRSIEHLGKSSFKCDPEEIIFEEGSRIISAKGAFDAINPLGPLYAMRTLIIPNGMNRDELLTDYLRGKLTQIQFGKYVSHNEDLKQNRNNSNENTKNSISDGTQDNSGEGR